MNGTLKVENNIQWKISKQWLLKVFKLEFKPQYVETHAI